MPHARSSPAWSGRGPAPAGSARPVRQVQRGRHLLYLHGWSGVDYGGADGLHIDARLDDERLCLLVLIGVRDDGSTELITLSGQSVRRSVR
jgi:hypothetical protein